MLEKGSLISNNIENQRLLQYHDKCDKYDYLIAVACGAIGGLVDIFFVGAPGESELGKWTDTQVDNAVKKFAKMTGWSPREGKENNLASAIGYLERTYKVNYDQRYSSDVGELFRMTTKNHHMKSLSHSPDIVGLFFSVLNQFTSTSSFISDGQVITIATDTYELQGGNVVAKIFCGVANWFGHIMSDIAGSSGSVGNGGRGTGVVIPFYEFFQFCTFGRFDVGKDKQDLATIATRAFQEGYDFRHGLTMAIPVVITDLSIRLIWALRRHFQKEHPLRECIPTQKYDDLRVMLLVGNGTLCVMDGIDAGVKSGGNYLAFFMRLNLIAWFRFVSLVLKEVCIRTGLANCLDMEIEALVRMNEALKQKLAELEKIDFALYQEETEKYNELCSAMTKIQSEEELTKWLINSYAQYGIELPWAGDFDEFMSDPQNRLVFK